MTDAKKAISEYLSTIGSKGGKAGTGSKKRRSREQYQEMAKKSHATRKRSK